jgi:hypothetical protein
LVVARELVQVKPMPTVACASARAAQGSDDFLTLTVTSTRERHDDACETRYNTRNTSHTISNTSTDHRYYLPIFAAAAAVAAAADR